MYVGVPKNYGGTAFQKEKSEPQMQCRVPPTLPHSTVRTPPPHEKPSQGARGCEGCAANDKSPLSCLLNAFRRRKHGGLDTEDFLLLGLIALLIGKEGNEDIVFILAMLLLM